MGQPLNDGAKKRRMNRAERKREKHSATIEQFSLGTESQIRNGFVAASERKPTNCMFFFLFFAFLIAMIVCSVVGFVKGDPETLIAGVDADGRICGYSEGVENYPNLYYFRLPGNKRLAAGAACVERCPTSAANVDLQCAPTNVLAGSCAVTPGYATQNILGYCVPTDFDTFTKASKQEWDALMQNQAVSQFYKDLKIAQTAVYISLALGLVYTLAYLYAMSSCAHVLAYIAIGLLELLFIAGMGGALYGVSQSHGQGATGFWITFASLAVAFLIFNLLMWCYWTKLQIAIAVIDATADFMVATKRIALVTIYYFTCTIIAVLAWALGLVGVVAMNDVTVEADANGDGGFQKVIHWTGKTRWMTAMMIFGVIWVCSFLREKARFVYMISASQFYFSSSADGTGSASVLNGMSIVTFKHSGSVALGSLLHTIVFILRVIVDVLTDAAQKKSGNNGLVVVVGCLLRCCVRWLEGVIEYLNATAYAFMSISGDPYCRSAWNGFLLNLKHLVKFYFANTLAKMIVFMGVLAIIGVNCGTCYLILRYGTKNADQLGSVWVPMVFILITTFITAELFIGFFHVALRATLMCFAVDLELNGKIQFGSPSFHERINEVLGKLDGGAEQGEIVVHTHATANTFQQQPNGGYAPVQVSDNTAHQQNRMV
jgi:hypothetical protein